ncbi:MAG: tetratricopeptide repeat protein [Cyclobacteriaceae bacterium]
MRKLIVIFQIFILFSSFTQTSEVDSLLTLLPSQDDTERANTLILLSTKTFYADASSSREWAEEALLLSIEAQHIEGILSAYNLIGITYDLQGIKDSARYYFTKFHHESILNKRPDKTAAALNSLGMWHWNSGRFNDALNYYFDAARIADSLNDQTLQGKVYNNIGLIYQELNDYHKALGFNHKALEYRLAIGDENGIVHSYNNLGICYKRLDRPDSSRHCYLKGLEMAKEINDQKSLSDIHQNLGVLEMDIGNYDTALAHVHESLKYSSPLSQLLGKNTLCELYLRLGDHQKSIIAGQEAIALANQFNNFGHLEDTYYNLSQAHILAGNKTMSLELITRWNSIKDSLFSAQSARAVNELSIQFETEKKEQQIALQAALLSEKEAQLQTNRIFLVASAILLILLVIIGLLTRSRARKKQELAIQKERINAQEAEINAVVSSQEKERARYARDLHDGFGQMISILNINLGSMKKNTHPDERQRVFEESEKVINEMYDELKGICFDMMPQTLVKKGLPSGLNEFAQRINQAGHVFIETNFYGLEDRLLELQEISLFRIAQEWINNILKHSDADRVILQITRDEQEITLLIEDNGTGFDKSLLTSTKGNGWKNLNTRAHIIEGTLELETSKGRKGTSLIVNAPISLDTKAALSKNTISTVLYFNGIPASFEDLLRTGKMNLLSFIHRDQCTTMKIYLTDDHAILLGGLTRILSDEDDLDIVGSSATVKETLDDLTRLHVDLLITDYNLPDDDGLSLIRRVKVKYPELKIIVLSMHDEAHLVQEILKEGIQGYILKKDSQSELLAAVRAVKNGKIYLSSDINAMLMRGLNGNGEQKLLTDREREILKLIAKEYTNKNIAEALFISERTVETHRKNIFRKTGTNNMVGLIKYAYANNLI